MKSGLNGSEKSQIVIGEFFLGDEGTGLKICRKINDIEQEIEIELKSGTYWAAAQQKFINKFD